MNARLKQAVIHRAQECCEYCQSQARFATHPFSIEHIHPLSRGGEDTLNNLALACQGCNNYKYTKVEALDPVNGQPVPLFHPRQQRWIDHFRWADRFTHIVGITPTGRATVEALQLNRRGLVNLRRILFAAGVHPPSNSNRSE
ncbi:MAG: HNH endonuclease [Gemmatimonadetes bacterium]|nr:HNH endonuclease [Gemmatimonadota bacterium]